MNYDVIIIGAGPGGIFSAYELVKENSKLKIAVFETGMPLEKRKYNITNAFGGTLYEYIGKKKSNRVYGIC